MEGFRGRMEEAQDAYMNTLDSEQIFILRQRAQLMGGSERVFLELVLDRGSSFKQIAHLTGQGEGSVRRHFRKLIRRLISKETLAAIRHPRLSAVEQSVARAYYIEGLSQDAIAQRTGTTPYFIRKTLARIQSLAKAASASTPGSHFSSPRAQHG